MAYKVDDGKGMGNPKSVTPEESVSGSPPSGAPSEYKGGKFGPSASDGPNPGRAPGK